MPRVYICNRCAEKIDEEKQDWITVSIDTAGSAGLETRAHADCEVKRLKGIQLNALRAAPSISRGHV